MAEPEIQKYCDLMEEIKRRVAVVDFFLTGKGHALYEPTTIESVCLQFRKILELIAFGSVVANKDLYSAAHAKFAADWNARLMLKDLERVNPEFYPKPVVETPSPDPRATHQLKPRQPDYMTRDDFEKLYEKCGSTMHADNPYGSHTDYKYYRDNLLGWRNKIVNLLNNHQIKLVGQRGFYVVHMRENRDDKVHYYLFAPPPGTSTV
jgi:hypothetical protein